MASRQNLTQRHIRKREQDDNMMLIRLIIYILRKRGACHTLMRIMHTQRRYTEEAYNQIKQYLAHHLVILHTCSLDISVYL